MLLHYLWLKVQGPRGTDGPGHASDYANEVNLL